MNKEWSELNKLTKRKDEVYHKWAQHAGITDTKFWIFYAICESGGVLSQNDFCDNWCYSKQTVNAAVNSLEKEGMLYLSYAEGSKKKKDIRLTITGEEFCTKYILPVLNAECNALMRVEEQERRMYLDTKEKMISILSDELRKTTLQA